MDTERTTYFLAKLLESPNVRVIGIDPEVATKVIPESWDQVSEGLLARPFARSSTAALPTAMAGPSTITTSTSPGTGRAVGKVTTSNRRAASIDSVDYVAQTSLRPSAADTLATPSGGEGALKDIARLCRPLPSLRARRVERNVANVAKGNSPPPPPSVPTAESALRSRRTGDR